jgi:hypothetical protein
VNHTAKEQPLADDDPRLASTLIYLDTYPSVPLRVSTVRSGGLVRWPETKLFIGAQGLSELRSWFWDTEHEALVGHRDIVAAICDERLDLIPLLLTKLIYTFNVDEGI